MASPAIPPPLRPTPTEPTLSFLSHELKEGEPLSFGWEDFKQPKLRKFPKAPSTLRFTNFVGAGVDGMVFRAKTYDGEIVAVKIFHHAEKRRGKRYWSFQRECCNCAILDMIRTGLRDSDVTRGRPLFLLPRPKTREDAIRNLRAFSTEYSQMYRASPPAGFESLDSSYFPNIQINDCLGWTQLDGRFVLSLIRRTKCYEHVPELHITTDWSPDPWYFAIIYRFVPEATNDDAVILAHLNFFYRVGFAPEAFKADNWRGPGILVDFSDLTLPFEPGWRQCFYGWSIKDDKGFYTLEHPNWPSIKGPPNRPARQICPQDSSGPTE